MTEHIVQFAVGIDDDGIRKAVESSATKEIINQIKRDILNRLFESHYYRHDADPNNDPLSSFASGIVREVIGEYKEEIISRAAELLVDSYKRTKAWKEAAGGVTK